MAKRHKGWLWFAALYLAGVGGITFVGMTIRWLLMGA